MAKTIIERFEEKIIPEPNSGCWLWLGSIRGSNYGQFSYKKKQYYAHRISYEIYCEPILKDKNVLHKCDTSMCVNPDHLFLGSQYENMQDMNRKKRHGSNSKKISGEKHPNAKLNRKQVEMIREDKRTYMTIAKEYGISRSQVCVIKHNKGWL